MATLEQIAQAETTFLGSLNNNVNTALSELNALASREYSYTHEELVTTELEEDYAAIIEENSDLATSSAVGMLAVLKDGDTVSMQGNRMFINGSEELTDYSFSGENSQGGIEIVKVWFIGTPHVRLEKYVSCEIFNIIIKRNSSTFTTDVRLPDYSFLNSDYYRWKNFIVLEEASYSPQYCQTVTVSGLIGTSRTNRNYYMNAESIIRSTQSQFILNDTFTEKIVFNNLTVISAIYPVFESTSFQIEFPKLETVRNTNNQYGIFSKMTAPITLPETVEELTGRIFRDVTSISLDCKNARSIDNVWCVTAPTYFYLCPDWGASINISVAAANWSISQFIDLFTSKLRDMTLTGETRTLTIPTAKLTALQSDSDGAAAIEAAIDKGWTIGGA